MHPTRLLEQEYFNTSVSVPVKNVTLENFDILQIQFGDTGYGVKLGFLGEEIRLDSFTRVFKRP